MRLLSLPGVFVTLLLLSITSACQSSSSKAGLQATEIPTLCPALCLNQLYGGIQTTPFTGPLIWKVEIVQRDVIVPSQDDHVNLRREPFTLRVTLPQPFDVIINALDKDTNFRRIAVGQPPPCPGPLCMASSTVEDATPGKPPTTLILTEEANHNLSARTPGGWLSWTRSDITQGKAVFERDVLRITMFEHDVLRIDRIPIENYPGEQVYLLIWVNYRDTGIINEDELKKIVIDFQN